MTESNTSKNADLIYQYTFNLAKEQRDSIIRLDTKLSALLGFSGLTLRFTESLHSKPFSEILHNNPEILCLICKIISCVFALVCAGICVHGLQAKTRGIAVDPSELLKIELYERDVETNKCYITKAWIKSMQEYEDIGKNKGKKLNLSLWLIILSVIFSTINTLIYIFFIQN